MPAKSISINLLGKEDLAKSSTGRLLTWATTYGRYIMVGTEVIVLLAFISRFSLDRKLTDLKEEISQKQAILEANADLETNIRAFQSQLTQIKTILGTQSKPVDLVTFLQSILPPDVYFTSINIQKDKMIITATAGTTESFGAFFARLAGNKQIAKIDVGEVQKHALKGIEFKFTAQLANTK